MTSRIKAKINYWISYISFIGEFIAFRNRAIKSGRNPIPTWSERYACFNYKTTDTKIDRHYVYHTAWAARVLERTRPEKHTDISSTLYFIAMVSAFVPMEFYDYRPANLHLKNLSCGKEDLLKLSFPDNSIRSLSCMHVLEHIGLGRYGDTIDPNGDIRAMNELKRVLAHNGDLLIAVPLGKPAIMFNAHRIYSYDQIMNYFKDFKLIEFALIPDNEKDGDLVYNAPKELADRQTYACGCFWFKK
jgi:hypothetical protein